MSRTVNSTRSLVDARRLNGERQYIGVDISAVCKVIGSM